MFMVKVHYKDKDTVLSRDCCPEFVGCRHYFYKRRADISSKNTNTNHDSFILLHIATLNCEGIKRSDYGLAFYLADEGWRGYII